MNGLVEGVFRGGVGATTGRMKRRPALFLRARVRPRHRAAARFDLFVDTVDFPVFVQDLVNGVFAADVEASLPYVDASAKLVGSTSESVKEFMEDDVAPNQGRDRLAVRFAAGSLRSS